MLTNAMAHRLGHLSQEVRLSLIEVLDAEVHDLKSAEATKINNAGLIAQVEYVGEDYVLEALDVLELGEEQE